MIYVCFDYSFFQLLTHKIFSCYTIFETSHSKCKITHQISKTISYFSAFDSTCFEQWMPTMDREQEEEEEDEDEGKEETEGEPSLMRLG